MFYNQHMVWHMFDRAGRWHAGVQISSKSTESLCDAISECWLQVLGAFKRLVIDGESGLNSEGAKIFLKGNGIHLDMRAVGQHASIVERRGAILRHTMHCIEEQMAKEGIPVTFKQLLGQLCFGGNCLINY